MILALARMSLQIASSPCRDASVAAGGGTLFQAGRSDVIATNSHGRTYLPSWVAMRTAVVLFTHDLRVHDHPASWPHATRPSGLYHCSYSMARRLRARPTQPNKVASLLDALRDLASTLRDLVGVLVRRRGRLAETSRRSPPRSLSGQSSSRGTTSFATTRHGHHLAVHHRSPAYASGPLWWSVAEVV